MYFSLKASNCFFSSSSLLVCLSKVYVSFLRVASISSCFSLFSLYFYFSSDISPSCSSSYYVSFSSYIIFNPSAVLLESSYSSCTFYRLFLNSLSSVSIASSFYLCNCLISLSYSDLCSPFSFSSFM